MPRRPTVPDRGAATLETVGGIAAAALVIVLVVAAMPGPQLSAMTTAAVCTVKTMSVCTAADTTAGTPGTSDPADTGGRRDQERQTRDDRRGRGSDKAPDDDGTAGTSNNGDALGTGVPGTSVPTPPPPPWKPADGGAGEYDSETAWPWDHGKKVLVETAANLMAGKWPDASRNLSHYLANTGEPLQQDVDRILHDVPGFQAKVDELKTSLGEDAVARARASGATGPVTFPLSTDWNGYYIDSGQSQNWFYALGGVSYNLTGQVTAYPPTSPGGAWRYEVSSQVNLRDQYNWDGGKSTDIGPITVSDSTLAALHRQGLAREYRNEGTSDVTTTKGSVP